MNIHLRVPGKLVLAGEYAVLEPGFLALVTAVDRFLELRLTPSDRMELRAEMLGIDAAAEYRDGRWSVPGAPFVAEAATIALRYLAEKGSLIEPFRLEIEGGFGSGSKYGLGGSGAVTVGVVGAILRAHGMAIESAEGRDTVFRLAAIAHLRVQGGGSGIDLAASTYGGTLLYSSFNPAWLMEQLALKTSIVEIVEGLWPFLKVEALEWPAWELGVAWTGRSSSTSEYLSLYRRLKDRADPGFPSFLARTRQAVDTLARGIRARDLALALEGMEAGRQALSQLSTPLGAALETPELARFATIAVQCGGRGKPSGAGGGDCGIALFGSAEERQCAETGWLEAGLEPLELRIARGLEVPVS